jgi:anaerobic magnesium-protoporphyrin IX monomethyl ester cyclase
MAMKAVLYNPRERRKMINPVLPFSLMVVGTELRKEGYEVRIVDGRLGEKIEDALDGDVTLVGITCMTGPMIEDALHVSEKVKKFNPSIKILWGGFHPSLMPEQTKLNEFVDEVVVGRYKENDELDYSIIDIEKYVRNEAGVRTIDYLSSRGCPHRCAFCSISKVYGRVWQPYDTNKIISDLDFLITKYNIQGVHFMDDNFFASQERVENLIDKIEAMEWKLEMWAMCRCDYMSRFTVSFLEKIRKAGINTINFGAESGSPDTLKYIHKDITPEDIISSAEVCKKFGFKAEYSFMIGFPEETEKDRELTFKIIDRLHEIVNPDIKVFMFTPFPGTELYEEAKKKGLKEPQSLAEWADFEYESPITPWVPNKVKRMFRTLTYIAWFAFTPDMEKKFGRFYQKVAYRILRRDALFRWKHRFFGFAPEWLLFRKIAND